MARIVDSGADGAVMARSDEGADAAASLGPLLLPSRAVAAAARRRFFRRWSVAVKTRQPPSPSRS